LYAPLVHLRATKSSLHAAINMLAFADAISLQILCDVPARHRRYPSRTVSNRTALSSWVGRRLLLLDQTYADGSLGELCGEHPHALDAVQGFASAGALECGVGQRALAGMGGATLSVFLSSSFSRNMTAGRGFHGAAALIFERKPLPTAMACLFVRPCRRARIRPGCHHGDGPGAVHSNPSLCGDDFGSGGIRRKIPRSWQPVPFKE
jgi:simple sugar transport system permease protein